MPFATLLQKFGYKGLPNDRDSLDRVANDSSLPDRMRAAIVKGTPAHRNPDLTTLFNHIDLNGNGFIGMNELVPFLMKFDRLHPTIADCEAIFHLIARGTYEISLESWLDWLAGRMQIEAHSDSSPKKYSTPSCPTLGWRALAGVNIGNRSYDVVSNRLREQLRDRGAVVKLAFKTFDKDGNMRLSREEVRSLSLSGQARCALLASRRLRDLTLMPSWAPLPQLTYHRLNVRIWQTSTRPRAFAVSRGIEDVRVRSVRGSALRRLPRCRCGRLGLHRLP